MGKNKIYNGQVITPELETWAKDAIYKTVLSQTWKERHAKGVPVKMTFDEWSAACEMVGPTPKDGYQHGSTGNGIPRVRVFDRAVGSGLGPRHMATFCNFRYRPEWLEKKGGKHASV